MVLQLPSQVEPLLTLRVEHTSAKEEDDKPHSNANHYIAVIPMGMFTFVHHANTHFAAEIDKILGASEFDAGELLFCRQFSMCAGGKESKFEDPYANHALATYSASPEFDRSVCQQLRGFFGNCCLSREPNCFLADESTKKRIQRELCVAHMQHSFGVVQRASTLPCVIRTSSIRFWETRSPLWR